MRLLDRRLEDLRLVLLRELAERLRGTRAPDRRASDSPIAIACLRLVTRLRVFPPLFKVPRLRSRMAFPTFFDAFLLYFGIVAPSMRTTDSTCGADRAL